MACRATAHAEATAKCASFGTAGLDKYPVELSGKMRQRDARTLAVEPNFIFFYELFTVFDVALSHVANLAGVACVRRWSLA